MRKKTKILAARRAGKDHQVVTVQGGGESYRRKPCATCPWRVDAVGIFPAQAFKHSANTAYDMAQHSFACHASGTDKPATCAGFLLRGAAHNLAVRIAVSIGRIDPRKVKTDVELFDNYRAMAEANGVPPDDAALERCR